MMMLVLNVGLVRWTWIVEFVFFVLVHDVMAVDDDDDDDEVEQQCWLV